jgi:hypothetical protein
MISRSYAGKIMQNLGMLDAQSPLLTEATGLQTFVVDTVVRRDLGNGIASIINCRKLNGVIVPQCEIIIAAAHLVTIGRGANDFAQQMHRRQQLAPLHALRMDGPAH